MQVTRVYRLYFQQEIQTVRALATLCQFSDIAALAYSLDQTYNFRQNGSYYSNSRGLGEQWIFSDADASWYVILPDGKLYQWQSGVI